jgi:hypothetical protein
MPKQVWGAWWTASSLIFNKRNKRRSAMTEERWESDLADIILSLCVDDSSPGGWVTVEQVQPEMTKRGYTLPNNQLTDAVGVVAASNNWQIEQTGDGGGIRVRPY